MTSTGTGMKTSCTVGVQGPATGSGSQTSMKPASPAGSPKLPKGKETNLGLYVTAREAFEMWTADPQNVMILDVRTTDEFLFVGHPIMAWNIPAFLQSYEWDAGKGGFPMKPNPDFVSQVKEVASPAHTILVTCRSGGRGALAVNLLAASGFEHVYNITDGIEGDAVDDPGSVFLGHRLKNGWKNSGLPWTYTPNLDRMVLPRVR